MKEILIIILLLGCAIWPALGQNTPANILIGESQILACYPEMAEFSINVPASLVTIVRFDGDGNDHQSTYKAILTQTEPDVYRAEFCASSWLEINAVTGSTTMCHLGELEVFFPASYVGR